MVSRAETRLARFAVVVGALERQRPEGAVKCFRMPARVARGLAAMVTRNRRPDMVGKVRVEPLLDGAGCYAERLTPRGDLDGLEVPGVDGAFAYERVDLGEDFRSERGGERRLFSDPDASTGRASQMASLTSSRRPQVARKPRYVWTSRSIFESTGPGRS